MTELHDNHFDDGRGRFPDKISFNAPLGFRDRAQRAAAKEGIPLAEFVRRRLDEAISDRAPSNEHGRDNGRSDA